MPEVIQLVSDGQGVWLDTVHDRSTVASLGSVGRRSLGGEWTLPPLLPVINTKGVEAGSVPVL